MGLKRGNSATGDFEYALKYAKLVLPLALSGPSRTFLEDAIKNCRNVKTSIKLLIKLLNAGYSTCFFVMGF
jgi:hypothetical protein